jgi:hypothetical protein
MQEPVAPAPEARDWATVAIPGASASSRGEAFTPPFTVRFVRGRVL